MTPALTICQPYAHLISVGEKPIENRVWSTAYRGPLIIHAGKSRAWMADHDRAEYTFGAIVAVVDLQACLHIRQRSWGRWEPLRNHHHANGPWCWVMDNVRLLREPVPCDGKQRIWWPDLAIEAAVMAALVEPAA